MLDDFRTRPSETLTGILTRQKEIDPGWREPLSIQGLRWMFLKDGHVRDFFARQAVRLFVKRGS